MNTTPSIEDAARLAASAPGWLTTAEGRTLYETAASCRGTGVIGASSEGARTFNEPIEALVIDCDHDLDAVQDDVELWVPSFFADGTDPQRVAGECAVNT